VINLSNEILTQAEKCVLAAGIGFIPTSSTLRSNIQKDLDRLFWRMKTSICASFFESTNVDTSVVRLPSKFNPETYQHWRVNDIRIREAKQDCLSLIKEFTISLDQIWDSKTKLFPNLVKEERSTLRHLKDLHPRLTFVEADKDCAIVVVTKDYYTQLCYDHLKDQSTYKRIGDLDDIKVQTWRDVPSVLEVAHRFDLGMATIFNRCDQTKWKNIDITAKEKEFLIGHLKPNLKEVAVPGFRILMKTHKKVLAGRPIAGAWNWITTPYSKYLSKKLRPIIEKTYPFFIRDSKQFVQQLDILRQHGVKKGTHLLAVADIKSMYPSIDMDFGLKSLKEYLLESKVFHLEMIQFLCAIADLVLRSNIVQFGSEFYLQIKGTAMGTNFAPEYAYMVYWAIEKQVFRDVRLNTRPKNMFSEFGTFRYYGRYIDDLFMVLDTSQMSQCSWDVTSLKQGFNQMGQLILDEMVISEQVSYLDTLVTLTENGISVAPYAKPTTTFLYIPPFSMHHPSVMRAWPINELKRLLLLSSDRSTYIQAVCSFLTHLKMRGYPIRHLKEIRRHVLDHRYRREVLWEGTKPRSDIMPIVLPYCDNIGRYNPKRIMDWTRLKVGVTSPLVKKWKFVSAWRRKPNLSETLRIKHSELDECRKRKRCDLGHPDEEMMKRTKVDIVVGSEEFLDGVGVDRMGERE
jgi:hypothetical protein